MESKPEPPGPDAVEVRRCVDKILASRAFANARRVQQFLAFVVEETLAGRGHAINEPLVAARVFNLADGFDRSRNSIVRAGATHLRRRLRNYYAGEGRADPVVIELPAHGYAPAIRVIRPNTYSLAAVRRLMAALGAAIRSTRSQ